MIRTTLAACFACAVAVPVAASVDIQEITSPDGHTAWLVEDPSIPFAALELRFRGGASLDASGKRGATNLMIGLLEEGAGAYDSQEFTIALEGLAADIRFDLGDDVASVSARFLSENRDDVIDLLRLALNEPTFAEADVERVRAQVLANIAADAKDPDFISGDTFDVMAFPDHAYGSDHQGTAESVAALTRDDLVTAKDALLAQDRVYASAVGDIDAETLGAILDEVLSGLPEVGAALPEERPYDLEGGITVVDYPTPQSVITFGQKGMKRHDEDFFPAFLMTQILGGGGFSSRLTEEVRVKRGLTYGIGAYLYPADYSEMLMGRVSTVNDRVGETVDVIRTEWEKLATEGVSEEELERAKTYLTGAYPLRFDGNARIANILVGMQMDDLTPDYIVTRNDKVRAVTVEDIKRVASELIEPDGLHFVIVGQPTGLEGVSN